MAKKKESRKVAIEAVRTSRKRLLTNESPFAIKEAYVVAHQFDVLHDGG